jgi:RNA polymerase sigma-70 factor (ECF subfamily)
MNAIAEKHASTLDEAIAGLLSRCTDRRGLEIGDLSPRVRAAIEKYLGGETLQNAEIRAFIDEIHCDDLCLIVACEKGDEKAWEDLAANFDSTVKSAARKISSNNEDAEDLASSIWAELYGLRVDADGRRKTKLAYYSGRGSLAGWLRAVVSQLAVDQYRKQSKFVQVEEAREFENLANEAGNNDNNHFISHTETPEEIFASGQTSGDVAAALAAAIDGLDPEERLILKMYYFDDLKLKEIAATFGYHEATASRKLARVQSDIRKEVEKGLRERHGWTEIEVKNHLSETAAKLGINLETMFAVFMLVVFVQDFWV